MFDRSTLESRAECPLCCSPDRRDQLELDGFHIVRCTDCEFSYVVEVADDAANVAYYEGGYAGERHRQGQLVNASINVDMLGALGNFRGRSLLDVGSGFGFLVARARDDLAMEASGAELSIAERDWAKANLAVDSYASLDDIPSGKQFDVITMFEVIEHLRDPAAMIRQVSSLLTPNGVLVVGTDNFDSAAVRAMGAGFPKWIPNQHISLFSPKTLKQTGEADGAFAMTGGLSYTPWEYWARVAVMRATGGRKGAKTFRLEDELKSEDSRGYRFFPLRRAANAQYVRYARRRSLDGAMMYAAFQKVS